MALNPIIIERDYFQNVQNRKGFMKAADFDYQFNNIANYINASIVPLLKQLASNVTPGSSDPNKLNTYLKNVGDGTTAWSKITFSDIPDHSLSYSKLVQSNPCSILATAADQIFRAVTPVENRQSLISQDNEIPVWKKITAANIEDRQITDIKIALNTLVRRNFRDGILSIRLTDDSVTTAKIANNTIGTTKIASRAVNSDILGEIITNQFCGINGSRAILWNNTLPDNIIDNPGLITIGISPGPEAANEYAIDHTKITPDFRIPPQLYCQGTNRFAFYTKNLSNQCIEGYQIKDNSLNGNRLFWKVGQRNYEVRGLSSLLGDGCIGIENLPPSYKAKLGL